MKDFKKMGVLSQQGEKWKKIEVELERKHILVVKSIEESGNQKFLKKYHLKFKFLSLRQILSFFFSF